jgi:hypothetical protein
MQIELYRHLETIYLCFKTLLIQLVANESNPPRRPCVDKDTGDLPPQRTTDGRIGNPLLFVTERYIFLLLLL